MSASLQPEARLVQYLLGDLSAEEHAQMEERLFNDDALSEELHAAADDLIQAYLAGSLSEGERARFETYFLASSRRRQRLDFMRALLPAVRRTLPARARQRWVPWAVAAGLAIAAAALVAVQLRSRQRALEIVATVPSPASTPTVPPSDHPGTQPEEIPVIRLGRAPAGKPIEVPVSESTRVVRLEVAVPDEGPAGYHAVLRSAAGKEIWRAKGLAPTSSGAPLVVVVPARVLVAADYRLSIGGETLRDESAPRVPAREFALRVVRQRQSP